MNSEISKAIGKRITALLAKKFKRQKDLNKWLNEVTKKENILDNI